MLDINIIQGYTQNNDRGFTMQVFNSDISTIEYISKVRYVYDSSVGWYFEVYTNKGTGTLRYLINDDPTYRTATLYDLIAGSVPVGYTAYEYDCREFQYALWGGSGTDTTPLISKSTDGNVLIDAYDMKGHVTDLNDLHTKLGVQAQILDMGTFAISNVGTVDGVDIAARDAILTTTTSATTGVSTTHSDISDAGSGIIISAAERTALHAEVTSLAIGAITGFTDNSTAWDLNTTYRGVGHLPLAGGTVSGNTTFSAGVLLKESIIFYGNDTYTDIIHGFSEG